MKIEEASQFLQVNAVAQRARQLILGSVPKVRTDSRRPTAIALAEMRAGALEVHSPLEAEEILAGGDGEDDGEERLEAVEAARAELDRIWSSTASEDGPEAAPAAGDDFPPGTEFEDATGEPDPEPMDASDESGPTEMADEPEPAEMAADPEPMEASDEPGPAEMAAESEPAEASDEIEPVEASDESEPVEASAEPEPVEASAEPEPVEATDEPAPAEASDEPEPGD